MESVILSIWALVDDFTWIIYLLAVKDSTYQLCIELDSILPNNEYRINMSIQVLFPDDLNNLVQGASKEFYFDMP